MTRGLHCAKKTRTHTKKGGTGMSIKNASLGLLMVAAATISGLTLSAAPHASAATAAADASAPPCPAGYTCVVLPCSSSACPTIEAGPTSDIGTDPAQYVFVNLYDFPSGDAPEITLCADTVPLSQAAPLCSTAPGPVYTPIFSDGSGFATYQVPEVENDGASPISGEILGNGAQKGTFYCDNGPDLCSLAVFDTNLDGSNAPDATNTAIIPITYQAATGGCPKATLVNTESDFGIEGLIATANESGCAGSDPALAFNTAVDSLDAVTNLATGGIKIAFTDDPQAADEQAALGGSTGGYAFIPVAVSADVIGSSALISGDPPNQFTIYPHTNFQLTPNMVAGLVTAQYGDPSSADLITGTKCLNPGLGAPKKLDPCPGMEALNSLTGFEPEQDYTSFVRSDNAGVTDEMFDWLCSAPDHTFPIAGATVTETDTSAQLLQATQWTDTSLDGKCPQTDQFPALASGSLNSDENPQNQSKALYAQVTSGAPSKQAGFAVMNWYEALYYGLNVAELQNANGQFVAPTQASVYAALGDATENSDGTLSYNYANTADAAAYPEPVVIYAAVSTQAQPATDAGAIKTVLDNVLALTDSPGKASIPAGILPLTTSLTTEAQADIAKDIVAEPTPPTGTTPPTTSSPGGSKTSTPGGSSNPGGSSTTSGNPGGSSNPGSSGSSSTATTQPAKVSTTGASKKVTPPAGKGPTPAPPVRGFFRAVQVGLAAPEWRWLLVGMLSAGAIAMCAGPLILVAQRLRRRLAVVRRGKT